MTTVDNLWYKADEARQRAEQTFHRLREKYDPLIEGERTKTVSRSRFRTLADRIRENGLPYGAHTLVYRSSGELLLVRHKGVDMWVLPGGEVNAGETLLEGARRELREEAGVEATYDGIGVLSRVRIRCDDHRTLGVLPVFQARAETTDLAVSDPDDEISEAKWFDTLPEDTRDRAEIRKWRAKKL